MAQSYVNLTLDTTAPSGLSIAINGGALTTSSDTVTVTVTANAPATGESYQLLMWGDVDGSDPNVKATEGTSLWFTYNTSVTLRLSAGDGAKTIYARIRDDVFNATVTPVQDSITLDTTKPVVTVTNPDRGRISLQATRNESRFSFSCDVPFVEYQVRLVSAIDSIVTSGSPIGTAGGSVNVADTGTFDTSVTPIDVTINALDLQTANGGEGTDLIVKVFCRDEAGNWSL